MQAYHRLIHRTLAKVPGGFVTASSPRGAFLRTLRSTTPATCGGAVLAAAVALTLVARGSLSSVSHARAVASSAAMSSDDREAGLQSLWADAFDAWVDVPGDADDVIFASPVDPSALATHSTPSAPFPPIVTDSRLFALTAFNPMGEDRPIAENRAANERLARDIRALDASPTPPAAWWRAYGFAENWREDGFVVAYAPSDAATGEKTILDLAAKYEQGAIYAYEPSSETPGAARRRTVSAAMSAAVEADVVLARRRKPGGMKYAERHVADEEY